MKKKKPSSYQHEKGLDIGRVKVTATIFPSLVVVAGDRGRKFFLFRPELEPGDRGTKIPLKVTYLERDSIQPEASSKFRALSSIQTGRTHLT